MATLIRAYLMYARRRRSLRRLAAPVALSARSAAHMKCGGEVLVIGTHLLGDSAHGYLLLNLREDEGQEEVLEDKDEEEEESEVLQYDRHALHCV